MLYSGSSSQACWCPLEGFLVRPEGLLLRHHLGSEESRWPATSKHFCLLLPHRQLHSAEQPRCYCKLTVPEQVCACLVSRPRRSLVSAARGACGPDCSRRTPSLKPRSIRCPYGGPRSSLLCGLGCWGLNSSELSEGQCDPRAGDEGSWSVFIESDSTSSRGP